MKSIDFPYIQCPCETPSIERYGAPYHYDPGTGEVYDVIGNYIGSGSMQDGKLIVTRHDTHINTDLLQIQQP